MQVLSELQRLITELENASEQLQIAASADITVKHSMDVVRVAAVKLSVIKERIKIGGMNLNTKQAQHWEKEVENLDSILEVGFKRLSEHAKMPEKAHMSDSGFDVFAAKDVIILPNATAVVPLDLAIVLPKGYDAYILPRSGISAKTPIRVVTPPIDNGYRGAIGVILDNTHVSDFFAEDDHFIHALDGSLVRQEQRYPAGTALIRKGDKIAQLIIREKPLFIAVEIKGELDKTHRGNGGFGSTGI